MAGSGAEGVRERVTQSTLRDRVDVLARPLPASRALVTVFITAVVLGIFGLLDKPTSAQDQPAQDQPRQDQPAPERAGLEFRVGPREQPTVGALVTWDYTVTNLSEVAFTDLVIDDAREGRVCLVANLAIGESRTCSLPTMAGITGYETTASATGTPVGPDGSALTPVIAKVKRTYFVVETTTPPEDLAFSDPPPLPNGTSPAWPIDRWGPYAIAMLIAAAVVTNLTRKRVAAHRSPTIGSTRRKSPKR